MVFSQNHKVEQSITAAERCCVITTLRIKLEIKLTNGQNG